MSKFSIKSFPAETLVNMAKSGKLTVPELKWDIDKVLCLLDSMYKGYPLGFVVIHNSTIIDGGQRIAALVLSLTGQLKIGFNVIEERFVQGSDDPEVIDDISKVYTGSLFRLVGEFEKIGASVALVYSRLEKLRGMVYNHIGVIELEADVDEIARRMK